MSKEEVIKIINDSLDELLDEVGNDYEYNGCNHLVRIIIERLNQKKMSKNDVMKNYLVKTRTSDDTFYVYYEKKTGVYRTIGENKVYYKDDIIIVRELY